MLLFTIFIILLCYSLKNTFIHYSLGPHYSLIIKFFALYSLSLKIFGHYSLIIIPHPDPHIVKEYVLFLIFLYFLLCYRLTILFRYKCDPTLGPSCFTDCVDHTDDEICPTLPPFTGTFQTATDPYCEHTGNNSGNCSAIAVTTQSPSETSSETSISNVNISTKRVYLDSGNNSKNQTMTTTNHASVNTNQQTTSAKVAIETSTALSSVSTTITSTKTKSSTKIINVSVQETIPGTSLTTTIDPPVGTPPTVKNDDDGGMTYWPAIVGGVLGGLALLAAAGFLVYYNRQK